MKSTDSKGARPARVCVWRHTERAGVLDSGTVDGVKAITSDQILADLADEPRFRLYGWEGWKRRNLQRRADRRERVSAMTLL